MEVVLTEEEIKEYTDEIIAYNIMTRFEEEIKGPPAITIDNYGAIECINHLVEEAENHESYVTSDLKSILPEDCHFEGLNNRIKTRERIRDKLIEDARKKYNNDFIMASNHLYDSLRYTVIMPFEHHFDYIDNFLNELLDMDYTLYRVKNRWADDFCKGVQVIAKDPNGYAFEIQIHTQENYDIKEIYSREPYNLSRNEKAPSILKDKANALRSYYHRLAKLPEGALTYQFQRREKSK
jgi:hypothetical protein